MSTAMSYPCGRPVLRVLDLDGLVSDHGPADGLAADPMPSRLEFVLPGQTPFVLTGWTDDQWAQLTEEERSALPPVYRFGQMYVSGVLGDPGPAGG